MDVFLGYAHDAAPFASRIRADLMAAEFTVWSVEEDVKPGEDWAEEVSRIIRDARNIIIVLTHLGATSSALTTEIALALATTTDYQDKRLVPILAEPSVELPFFLKRFQALDMSSDDKYAKGLHLLIRTLKERPKSHRYVESTEGQVNFLRVGEEALRIENEAWQRERLLRSRALFGDVLGMLSAVCLAIVVALMLKTVGPLQGAWGNPVVTLVIGAIVGVFAPQASQRLTDVIARLLEESKEAKADQ
jgi:hypothetical protein